MTAYQPLVDVTQPDLYLSNPFRMLNVPITANGATVRRRAERIRQRLEFDPNAVERGGPLRLAFPPDSERLKTAPQVVQDPQKRLLAELFWFWPASENGNGGNDPALAALAQDNLDAATALWSGQQSSACNGALGLHNLAILNHALALDWEQRLRLDPTISLSDEDLRQIWGRALNLWKIILDGEEFWPLLRTRIRELNDPQLPTGTARQIRDELPRALLGINARIAVDAASHGDIKTVARQLAVLKAAPFEAALVDRALSDALRPITRRLDAAIVQAWAETNADIVCTLDAIERLMAKAKPDLRILDVVLGKGHELRDRYYDKVAMTVNGMVVRFADETKNWTEATRLLDMILPFADGLPTTKAKLEENLKAAKELKQDTLCWFCKSNSEDPKCRITVKMFGDVRKEYVGPFGEVVPYQFMATGVRTLWRNADVAVGRCAECARQHKRSTINVCGNILLILSISILLIIFYGTLDNFVSISSIVEELLEFGGDNHYYVLGVFLASIIGIGLVMTGRSRGKKVEPFSAHRDHPRIKQLQKMGWQFGEKPADAG